MAAILRRFMSLPPSSTEEEDEDYSVEYSFALEYTGPPLASNIPRAIPIDVGQIPTALAIPSNSWLLDLSLPVISPIKRTGFSSEKSEEQSKLAFSESSSEADCTSSSSSCNKNSATSHTLDPPGSCEIALESFRHEDINEMEIVELESRTSSSSSSDLPQIDGSDYGSPRHVRKSSVVTFRDPDSGDIIDEEESVDYEPDLFPVKPRSKKNEKRGACYHCLRGNRFTEKEACIVCDAKFCNGCVLRAMGSMPEGRKCITCIGFRIDESKRDSLGKCSRMLKRVLTEEEIERVMAYEISCEPNQPPPNLVFVNGEPLSQSELALLRSCENPPKKLRPGCYWYDKVSGLWGKEGRKPCQIITAQLNIGGHIKRNASNGNTNILINKREITREELWILKVAGIACEGRPHFWLSEDGSYLLEGQKKAMGLLWEKRKTKLACAMLSLPVPLSITGSGGDKGAQEKLEQNSLRKLLLVGLEKSGTSTIFNQARLIYGVPFSEDERQNMKLKIQSNLYGYLGILLEGREIFAEESLRDENSRAKGKGILVEGSSSTGERSEEDNFTYSMGPRLKAFSDWLLKVIESGNLEVMVLSATREYARFVEELWKDGAIQATYNRRSELENLPRVATYFLERAVEISRDDYVPSDMDILYAEGITSSNGLACTEFSFPGSAQADDYNQLFDLKNESLRYELIRAPCSSLGQNCKWLEMFEDIHMVIFCVSLTDYDEFSVDNDGNSINKMLASKQLFETIASHPTFIDKDFFLVLNKFDLLEEKIERAPLSECEWFDDFCPVISHNHNVGTHVNVNASLAESAFHYVAVKFKRMFLGITGRKLFVSSVTGLEQESVEECMRYVRDVMNWEAREVVAVTNEESLTSLEASSS